MAPKGNTNAVKYDPKVCENLSNYFIDGQAIEEVCVELKITRKTYYNWIEKYPDFAEAAEAAALVSQAWWLKTGRTGATTGIINAPVWIFNMKNRLGWKDRVEQTGDQTINITVSKNDADTV